MESSCTLGYVCRLLALHLLAFVLRHCGLHGCCSTGTQPWRQQDANPSDNINSSTQQQRQQQGLTQEQVERDVQQLAADVFHKGQELAGGRCATASFGCPEP